MDCPGNAIVKLNKYFQNIYLEPKYHHKQKSSYKTKECVRVMMNWKGKLKAACKLGPSLLTQSVSVDMKTGSNYS